MSSQPPKFYSSRTTDIKSDNIVVDFDEHGKLSRIKLIDLGDSVRIEPTTSHPFTHPTYRAPSDCPGRQRWIYGLLVRW